MEHPRHTNAPAARPELQGPQDREERSFGPRDFRNALGRFATGITVVTMRTAEAVMGDGEGREDASQELGPAPGRPRTFGITVNAFMSVSLDPPLVAVSIDKRARAHTTLQDAERFGISVLAAGQEELSDLFAGRPVRGPAEPFERFADFPVVRGAIAQLVCRRYQAHDVGDHTIFVGEVEALRTADGEPLLFYKGDYHELPVRELAR